MMVDIVRRTVEQYGKALELTSKCSKKINWVAVYTAVNQDGFALVYASPCLQLDRRIVLAMIKPKIREERSALKRQIQC